MVLYPKLRAFVDDRYARPSWRRVRSMATLTRASFDPELYPSAPVVEAYWWDGHPNFGDALTPWIFLKRGIIPVHVEVHDAEVVGVGSLVQFIPEHYTGRIWGSGLISDKRHSVPGAQVLALRGPRTRDALGINSAVTLGDPGLLTSRLLPRPSTKFRIGFVPHGSHHDHPTVVEFLRRNQNAVKLIDVTRSPSAVIRDIASCAAIVSTSLHGVIVADSFGIPAAWTTLEPQLIGGDFKFLDHEDVVSPGGVRRFEFDPSMTIDDLINATKHADHDRVDIAINGLEGSLEILRASLTSRQRSPLRAWDVLISRKVRTAQ